MTEEFNYLFEELRGMESNQVLLEELNCLWCRHFQRGECLKGRRLRLRSDNHWWPLGTAGHPQPPRYCTMRESRPPLPSD